jgi:hypothetical protein
MQTANVLLALAGDRGNSVPKYSVTAAEIAVLMAIHGVDSVYDITPLDTEVETTSRAEKARLFEMYPARNEDGAFVVEAVYPGNAPVVHQDLADLGLPEELFATSARVTAKPKTAKPAKRAAKPRPATETAKADNSADDLFDDEDSGDEEDAGVMA